MFELNQLVEYTDEAILAELRRVAELVVHDGAITIPEFEKHGRVGVSTVRRRFGSWYIALEKAGLGSRTSLSIPTRGVSVSTHMTDDAILEHLRSLAAQLGKSELTV